MNMNKYERLNQQKKYRSEKFFSGKKRVAAYCRVSTEKEEQAQLRRDYIDSVKANLKSQLNTLYVLDEKTGKKTKIVDFERERAARAGKKKENR